MPPPCHGGKRPPTRSGGAGGCFPENQNPPFAFGSRPPCQGGGKAMTSPHLLALGLLLPVIAAALAALFSKRPNLREAVSLAAAAGTFIAIVSMSSEVLAGG